jgi:Mn2+/Fe2+ NRAMP family transporter
VTSRRILNWAIVIGVGLLVTLISYAQQPGGATTGYEAGRQLGYALGQGLVVAIVVYIVLRLLSRRSKSG